jgi:anti-sigma28 factor (negative regulator of flagellin synthesis)
MQSYLTSGPKSEPTIDLSKALRTTLMAKRLVHGKLENRAEKIHAIRKKIETGTYRIDFDKTAERILQAFVDKEDRAAADCAVFPVVEALSLC